MKHIGIVACSAEGAALCYQTICRDALQLVGKNNHPRVTMDSIPLAAWMPSFDAGDYRGVARLMLNSARVLAAAGADFAICPDNSAHRAWDYVQAETPIPWLHIGRVLGAEAQKRGYRAVGVLGTRFTMDGPVYRETLSSMGIETMVPEADDFETVDRIIFSELVDGVFTDASRQAYNAVIAHLRERGCEAVALACTEIPLLVRSEESPLPTLYSTRLLAAAALREALA
jgi:aspartate racemase